VRRRKHGEVGSVWATNNPKGIESFSPALADEIELRRVANQNGNNPEGVEPNDANDDATPMGLKMVWDG
jgi:hypothetical protein